MFDWHSCQICYPLEIKILLLLLDNASHYFSKEAICVPLDDQEKNMYPVFA